MIPIVSTEDDSDSSDEYVPPYKRQNLNVNENEDKVEIKYIENGEWNIVVKKV